MLTKTATICNKKGLHARAAAKFVKLAESHAVDIHVSRVDDPEQKVIATSILGLMMLAADPGTELQLQVEEGEEAEQAVAALVVLIEARFEEDH